MASGWGFDLSEARRLYGSGMSCRQIGERLGLSYSRVACHLREAGVSMRPSGRPLTSPALEVNVQELVRLRESGATYPCLAARYGSSTDAARDHYLRATGRPRRAPGKWGK
jgi:hypothetical protein